MIFDFFARIFGKSTYESSGIITTTIVERDPNMDIDDDDADGDDITINSNNCYLMAAPAADQTLACQCAHDSSPAITAKLAAAATERHHYRRISVPVDSSGAGCDLTVQFQQQTNRKTNQTNDMNNSMSPNHRKSSDEISVYTAYTLFASFFICICTIAALLMAYMNRVNDMAQLRADFNGKFVGRDDIDVIVRNLLHEFQIDDGAIHTLKRGWVQSSASFFSLSLSPFSLCYETSWNHRKTIPVALRPAAQTHTQPKTQ